MDTRLAVDGEPREALVECLRRVLAGVAPREVWGVALSGPDPATKAMEREAVAEALGREVERVVVPAELIGDTGAATGAFQLAALLALGEGVTRPRGRGDRRGPGRHGRLCGGSPARRIGDCDAG